MPYDEAMRMQIKADVLLLVQPGFPLQVPRKLYEYMALQRPILALTEEEGATARIVKQCHLGSVASNSADAIKLALYKMFSDWKEKRTQNPSTDLIANYKNDALARRLYALLEMTVANRGKKIDFDVKKYNTASKMHSKSV